MYRGFGATEVVPPEMAGHWPDQATYLAGLASSVADMADMAAISFDEGGILNPPIMAQVTALQVVLEGATGLGLGDIVSLGTNVAALMSAADVPSTVAAVSGLINVGIEIGSDVAQAVGAAANVMSVVPVIGGFIQGVASLAMNLAGAEARYRAYMEACQGVVEKDRDKLCARLVKEATPTATGPGGPLPADFFRPLAYKWKLKELSSQRLPLTPASLYVALTAGENQGMWGDRGHVLTAGIDPLVKRKMWSLIKGIMDSVEEPGIKDIPASPGDGGRALYPVLQDIVRNLWVAGVISKDSLVAVQDEILNGYYKYIECPELAAGDVAAGAMPAGGASCYGRVRLADPFEDGLIAYQNELFKNFWDDKTKTWKISGPTTSRPSGLLVLKGPALSTLMQGVSNAAGAAAVGTSFGPMGLSFLEKGLVTLGAAGFGYALFTALRQLGPGRA